MKEDPDKHGSFYIINTGQQSFLMADDKKWVTTSPCTFGNAAEVIDTLQAARWCFVPVEEPLPEPLATLKTKLPLHLVGPIDACKEILRSIYGTTGDDDHEDGAVDKSSAKVEVDGLITSLQATVSISHKRASPGSSAGGISIQRPSKSARVAHSPTLAPPFRFGAVEGQQEGQEAALQPSTGPGSGPGTSSIATPPGVATGCAAIPANAAAGADESNHGRAAAAAPAIAPPSENPEADATVPPQSSPGSEQQPRSGADDLA